jgi:hypothetical protein
MMKTKAWQSLGCVALCVYLEMARRYAGPSSNNGRMHYSLREGAKALKVGKSTIAAALKDLQERGFIEPTVIGSFNVKIRKATEWRLTAYPCDFSNRAATKDFERWQPATAEIQNTVPVGGRAVPPLGQHGTCRRTIAA